MSVHIWSSVVQNPRVAPPVRLEIRAIGTMDGRDPLVLRPGIRKKVDYRATIQRAYEATSCNFGWPKSVGFEIGIDSIDPDALPLPALDGNSHYGALVLALAQAVALAEPECVRPNSATSLHVLRSVFLQSVAVETSCDKENPNTDSFKAVGMLPAKLAGFCMDGIKSPPAICLVSPHQDLKHKRIRNWKEQQSYVPGRRRCPLPIYRVNDVQEAFDLLWNAQIRTLGRYV
jgi:hypothetical protein